MPDCMGLVSTSIAFIDSALPECQTLGNGIKLGTEAIILDRARDGVAQITAALASLRNIKSIHIICHGRSASLQLGAIDLNLTNLNFYGEKLQQWSRSLAESAEILLYGCEVAAGDAGAKFVQQISLLTKAKIAAARSPVGSAAKGGDWKLDYTTGSVESELAIEPATMAAYQFAFGLTLYDGTSNFGPFSPTPGIGASGTTQLAYGQVPLPFPLGSGVLATGAFSPNTTGINTASVTAANNEAGYAGYTNYKYTPTPETFNLLNPSFPALDRTNGYSVSFRVAVTAENSISNDRAGFSIIAISSDGQNGIELGFTNRNLAPSGGIFAQNGGVSPTLFTRGENAGVNISAATDYKLVVQGNTYTLFAGGAAIPGLTNQQLRNYTAFDEQASQPPLPYDPYSQPNFLFFGDATDQASATFTLGPISVNNFPVAVNDTYTTLHDKVLPAFPSVLSNDTDANNDPRVATLVTGPSNGTIVFNPLGDFTYTPKAGFVGIDTFTYSVSDGAATAPATVTINVTNKQPQPQPDTYTVLHDKILFSGLPSVLINDTDGDLLDKLTPALVQGPSNGTIVFNPLGDFTYTPKAGFVGIDTFIYSVSDGAATVPATVNINVTNKQPQPQPDTYTVLHDKILFSGLPSVLINDTDGDFLDKLTPALVQGPSNGTIVFNPLSDFTYTPKAGFVGIDTFIYSVSDGAATVPATVNINVTNSPPQPQPDTYTVLHDKILFSGLPSVLINDTDGDFLDKLTPALVQGPSNGTIVFNPLGDFTYTPKAGFVGLDTFTYSVSDGAATVPATVNINVINSLPIANPDIYSTSAGKALSVTVPGVLANDSDADSDTLTAALSAGPTKGSIALNKDGSFTYTPNPGFAGTDTFTYTVSDGIVNSAPAIVTVNVSNNPPVAIADSYTTAFNTSLNVAGLGVLINDTDPENDPLSAILVAGPTKGAIGLNAKGSFSYTPNAGFAGTDSSGGDNEAIMVAL